MTARKYEVQPSLRIDNMRHCHCVRISMNINQLHVISNIHTSPHSQHNEEDDDDDVVEELLDEGALMIFFRTFLIFIFSSSFSFNSFDFVEDLFVIQIIEGENTSIRI